MSESARTGPAGPPGDGTGPVVEQLGEEECMSLAAGHEVGRIAFHGRFGLTVFPVNYRLLDGTVVFRTTEGGVMDEDLRTGIGQAEYQVAFEIDDVDRQAREGWSVLIQGPAHHVASEEERAAVAPAGVSPWPGGRRERFIRISPTRITGRRIRRA